MGAIISRLFKLGKNEGIKKQKVVREELDLDSSEIRERASSWRDDCMQMSEAKRKLKSR